MQTIKMNKEYTIEEIRDEFSDKLNLVKDELERMCGDLDNINRGLRLKVLNMPNIRDNINVTRRELFMVDQALEMLSSNITVMLSENTEPAPEISEGEANE